MPRDTPFSSIVTSLLSRSGAISTHRGFSVIGIVASIGIVMSIASIAAPSMRNFQSTGDIDTAVQRLLDAMTEAQSRAQSDALGQSWGVFFENGTVFPGEEYATRHPEDDIAFPLPPSVKTAGLVEINFLSPSGLPKQDGVVHIISTISKKERTISFGLNGVVLVSDSRPSGTITSRLETPSTPILQTDSTIGLTGLHDDNGESADVTPVASSPTPVRRTSTQSTPGYSSRDVIGCGVQSLSMHGNTCSIVSQYASATVTCFDGATKRIDDNVCRSSADWHRLAVTYCRGRCSNQDSCTSRIAVNKAERSAYTIGTNDVTLTVLGSDAQYSEKNERIDVRVALSTDSGKTWTDLFRGKNVRGGEKEVMSNIPAMTPLTIRVHGRYGWIFNKTVRSDEGGHIIMLRRGDSLRKSLLGKNVRVLPGYLQSVVSPQGIVTIGADDILFLAELRPLDEATSYRDLALLASVTHADNSCADPRRPRFKVGVDDRAATKKPQASPFIAIGPQGMRFADEQWIPLVDARGVPIVDGGVHKDATGLTIERGDGWVKIIDPMAGKPSSAPVTADARVLFGGATITSAENVMTLPAVAQINQLSFSTQRATRENATIIYWRTDQAVANETDGENSDATAALERGKGDSCYAPFSVEPNTRSITLESRANATLTVAGSTATYGKLGPRIDMRARISFDNGKHWQNVGGGNTLYGGERDVFPDIAKGSKIIIEVNGRYSWVFKRTIQSTDPGGRIALLQRGETADGLSASLSTGMMQPYLRNLVNDRGVAHVTDRDILLLTNIGDDVPPTWNDLVMVLSMSKIDGVEGCTNPDGDIAVTPDDLMIDIGPPDADGDAVPDAQDWCPLTTVIPEAVPSEYMSFNRHAITAPRGTLTALPMFRMGAQETISEYSIADLHGCSCEEILDAIDGQAGNRFGEHSALLRDMRGLFGYVVRDARKFGCPASLMRMIAGYDTARDQTAN